MYTIDDNLKALAEKVIAGHSALRHLDDDGLDIVFLRCDKERSSKGRKVYADTEKLNDKHAALSGYRFAVTFYKDSETVTGERLEILMYHELRHIGWDGEKASIVPHDCEDFKDIINTYGTDWID